MAENVLSADSRTATGKGANRRLRVAGHIPGVVYGKGRDAQPVVLDPKALQMLLHKSGAGLNTLIDLSVAGRTDTVLVKELQRHPVHGSYVHVDFFQVDLTQKIIVSVPIHFVGKARGVEFGGILDHPLRELQVECLPRAIPEFVEVDVSALEVGQSIHVSDLRLPEGVLVMTDAALPVASVVLPAAEVEATPTETVVEGEVVEGEAAAVAPTETRCQGQGRRGRQGQGRELERHWLAREARRRARESRAALSAHASQRRLPRARRGRCPRGSGLAGEPLRRPLCGGSRRGPARGPAGARDLHEPLGRGARAGPRCPAHRRPRHGPARRLRRRGPAARAPAPARARQQRGSQRPRRRARAPRDGCRPPPALRHRPPGAQSAPWTTCSSPSGPQRRCCSQRHCRGPRMPWPAS